MKKTITQSSSKKIQNGSVRIIGGLYRGKKLNFPVQEGLRPTADRIRETLFNWLMHDIRNARCLDAFSGSGALGFEAYSRGAASVVFLEPLLETYLNLKNIADSFDTTHLTVIHKTAMDYLNKKNTGVQYDIIFIDPPFANPQLLECISVFEQSDFLINHGLLYVESPHEVMLNPASWKKLKLKKTGQVTYALYQKSQK